MYYRYDSRFQELLDKLLRHVDHWYVRTAEARAKEADEFVNELANIYRAIADRQREIKQTTTAGSYQVKVMHIDGSTSDYSARLFMEDGEWLLDIGDQPTRWTLLDFETVFPNASWTLRATDGES
jgi:hypothetical protein